MSRLTHAAAAASVLALAASTTNAIVLDISDAGASGSVNGAIYQQFTLQPTGTGVIDAFVRIHNRKDSAHGYNTDARPLEFDENNSPNFTRSLHLSEIPVVTIGGIEYREFLLDVNEAASKSDVAIDKLQVFLGAAGNAKGYPSALGNLIYDLDAGLNSTVNLDYLTSSGGSGKGDMLLFVPNVLFGHRTDNYVYLYSSFSGADAGFEEWAVDGECQGFFPTPPPIPEPAAASLVMLAAVAALARRRRRA